ncbi:MAG: DUF72 domain-containing protein, partial [Saprospiraceae bacterium]
MPMPNHQTPANYISGLSCLCLPIPKYLFPDEHKDSSRLTYYSTFFNSIEINSSFYKVPMSATVNKWQASVPGNFKFTFKLWKQITHLDRLQFDPSDVNRFMRSIDSAGNKKGCLLIQFPPKLGIDNMQQLQKLLAVVKETTISDPWDLAVEFRHKSWYHESTYELLDSNNAAMVIHDLPKSATPMEDLQTDIVYMRFHGPTGNYRGSYSDDVLSEYALYIKDWIEEGKIVYVYFNNTAGDAFMNLDVMNGMV